VTPPAVEPEQGLLACTFCGTDQGGAAKLIAGPSIFVCDRCVQLAGQVVRSGLTGEDAVRFEPLEAGVPVACGFCGKRDRPAAALAGDHAVSICDECVELCDEIIADEVPGAPGA
jgi:ATP-dependent protease Clp ATPase subunit